MTFEEYYNELNEEIKEYFKIVCPNFPKFIIPFIESDTLMRLRDVSYFCGMQYGSKEIYNFRLPISRLDHSISTALIVWNHTYNEYQTLAALFHDATTPAFSHVIDYMNNDAVSQESTELDLESFIKKDEDLVKKFERKSIDISRVANFKSYSLVDNERPKLCADRLDCLFLANLSWSKSTSLEEIRKIYDNIVIRTNEDGEEEYSFIDLDIADRVVELNDIVNKQTHSDEDFTSMNMLAYITKYMIDKEYISYDDLYILTDVSLMKKIKQKASVDEQLDKLLQLFINLGKCKANKGPIKNKVLNPLVLDQRYSTY